MNIQTDNNIGTVHKRIFGLDVFRGWAIVMMMIFHFSYDLWFFRLVEFDIIHDTFWVYFRYVIVTIFMVSVGISLGIVHTPHIRWDKVLRRSLIIGAAAIVVTISTMIQSPHAWVYFGILHLVFVASLAGLVFVGHPRSAVFGAVIVFVLSAFDMTGQNTLFYWLRPILHLPYRTEDLARFFPWFGAVLVGIAAYGFGWYRVFLGSAFLSSENRGNYILAFMGRHALVIYLVHLPILYGMVMFVTKWIL